MWRYFSVEMRHRMGHLSILCKTKAVPVHAKKACAGVEVWLGSFLTSALNYGELSASRPGRLTPEKTAPGTHWVGLRAILEWHE
jgi:hypothetical protein